ncbi:hypothetical protein O9992_04450 [Vibrio lentus]|nr:hypothetical protein [Vibrio lentus]
MPVVATNEVVFISEDLFDAHEIRVAIHDGFTMVDPRRPKNYSPQQYLRSEEEMCELFSDIPELWKTVLRSPSVVCHRAIGRILLANFPTEGWRLKTS